MPTWLLSAIKNYGPMALGFLLNRNKKSDSDFDENAFNEYANKVQNTALVKNNRLAQAGTARIGQTYANRGIYGSSDQGNAQAAMEGELNNNYQGLIANIEQQRYAGRTQARQSAADRKSAINQKLWELVAGSFLKETPAKTTAPTMKTTAPTMRVVNPIGDNPNLLGERWVDPKNYKDPWDSGNYKDKKAAGASSLPMKFY